MIPSLGNQARAFCSRLASSPENLMLVSLWVSTGLRSYRELIAHSTCQKRFLAAWVGVLWNARRFIGAQSR